MYNPKDFQITAENIARVGGEITLRAILLHMVCDHNNPSWVPTLADLKRVVEEMTGKEIAS